MRFWVAQVFIADNGERYDFRWLEHANVSPRLKKDVEERVQKYMHSQGFPSLLKGRVQRVHLVDRNNAIYIGMHHPTPTEAPENIWVNNVFVRKMAEYLEFTHGTTIDDLGIEERTPPITLFTGPLLGLAYTSETMPLQGFGRFNVFKAFIAALLMPALAVLEGRFEKNRPVHIPKK